MPKTDRPFAALPEILTADDLKTTLRISRATAYNLLNAADFPTLHVGKRKFVTRDNFLKWLEQHTDKIA
jgi:predicted DNA-binding transcriptional regulator AlpA